MINFGTFRIGLLVAAMTAVGMAGPVSADDAVDAEFAALQTDAKKGFAEGVGPFVKNYCVQCHGNKKKKSGLNFEAALKNPGNPTYRKHWNQAVAHVKNHDMPPDDEDAIPTDEAEKAVPIKSLSLGESEVLPLSTHERLVRDGLAGGLDFYRNPPRDPSTWDSWTRHFEAR